MKLGLKIFVLRYQNVFFAYSIFSELQGLFFTFENFVEALKNDIDLQIYFSIFISRLSKIFSLLQESLTNLIKICYLSQLWKFFFGLHNFSWLLKFLKTTRIFPPVLLTFFTKILKFFLILKNCFLSSKYFYFIALGTFPRLQEFF